MPDPISWTFSAPYFAAVFVLGYLLGSIPFGLILTRLAGLGDIRKIGSGNIGTTNVLRTGRKDIAAATLVADALKGTAAVLIAGQWGPDTAIIAGLGAFLGHLFPVWLRFKGGKGVATYLGILIGLAWPVALIFAATWVGIAFLTRYSSASALVASLVSPIALLWLGYRQEAELLGLLALLLWIMHRANIGRLIAGTESRIGQKT
ncbi:MAG: glycerol-3-phosphate 1-O-acyltransferase PlsY [Labrys sp. (in: a-proteobacteria)]